MKNYAFIGKNTRADIRTRTRNQGRTELSRSYPLTCFLSPACEIVLLATIKLDHAQELVLSNLTGS